MLKSELIRLLNNIEEDFEVVFPNVEYGGYEEISNIEIKKACHITEEGRKLCYETGVDYLSKEYHINTERLKQCYEDKERNIIALDR